MEHCEQFTLTAIVVDDQVYLMDGIDFKARMRKGLIDKRFKYVMYNCYRYRLQWACKRST